jgi:hypothetical protein
MTRSEVKKKQRPHFVIFLILFWRLSYLLEISKKSKVLNILSYIQYSYMSNLL